MRQQAAVHADDLPGEGGFVESQEDPAAALFATRPVASLIRVFS
jgi:hypothetical protein